MNFLSKADYTLLIFPVLLSIFGLTTVFSLGTSNIIFIKQLVLFLLGLPFAIIISFIDFRFLKQGQYIFIIYFLSLVSLLVLVVLGHTVNGAQSWFKIYGISLQPVEFAKLALIAILAKFFYKRHLDIGYLPTLAISSIYALLIFILTIFQPDLGSGLVVLTIWGMVVFISGIPKKYILSIFIIFSMVSFVSWFFLFQPFQKARILNFVDPTRDIRGSGYNVYQSIIAVGSGGIWGKGINFGSQSKLQFLPEYETDFVFAAFAEEWGYIGVVFCLLTYLFFILKILYIPRKVESNFEMIFIVGIVSYFIIHFCINVGMNLGLLPVTGIPLPFMSSGGSHVFLEWIMVGLIISFTKNEKRIQKEITKSELFVYQ